MKHKLLLALALLPAAAGAQTVRSIPGTPAHMVYDPVYRKLWVTEGNALVRIDPVTAAVETQFPLLGNGNHLAVSDDGKIAYVGLDDTSQIQTIDLTTGASKGTLYLAGLDRSFGPDIANDIAVAPHDPNTIAVAEWSKPYPGLGVGVGIYSSTIGGSVVDHYIQFGWVQFGATSSTIYTGQTSNPGGDVVTLNPTSKGWREVNNQRGLLGIRIGRGIYNRASGHLFGANSGVESDPATTNKLGSCLVNAGITPLSGLPQPELRKYYILGTDSHSKTVIVGYDLNRYEPVGALMVPSTFTASKSIGDLVTAGTNRMAFKTDSAVYIIDGILLPRLSPLRLQSNTVIGGHAMTGTVVLSQPAPAGGVTVTLTNYGRPTVVMPGTVTIPAGATQQTFPITTKVVASSITATIEADYGVQRSLANLQVQNAIHDDALPHVHQVPLPSNDISALNGQLLAAVPSGVNGIGNTLAIIDPATGNVKAAHPIGSEPAGLAPSNDGKYVYSILQGASAVSRYSTATAAQDLQVSMFGTSPIQAVPLPVQSSSFAVSRTYLGLQIFDNNIPRQNFWNAYSNNLAITPGADDSVVYGINRGTFFLEGFYGFAVDAQGVTQSNYVSQTFPASTTIKYDTGRIYTSAGTIINPATGLVTASLPLSGDLPLATAPDVAHNAVYCLTRGGADPGTLTLRQYDPVSLAQVKQTTLAGITGATYTGSLVVVTPGVLALRTTLGIYIIDTTTP